jgi:hypothetical protein
VPVTGFGCAFARFAFLVYRAVTAGHQPRLALHPAVEPARACSAFVTQFTFSPGQLSLVQNSMQLRGISGSERLPALRRYRICCQARGQR